MTFTHPYESNISLVKNLQSILETDPLAKELDIVIRLSTNLETKRKEAQFWGETGEWKAVAEQLRKENLNIASFMALLKKARAIEAKIIAEGVTRQDVIRNLKRIP